MATAISGTSLEMNTPPSSSIIYNPDGADHRHRSGGVKMISWSRPRELRIAVVWRLNGWAIESRLYAEDPIATSCSFIGRLIALSSAGGKA